MIQTDRPRSERAAEVARLLASGLNQRQAAERLGISRSYASALVNDPDGSKDVARKRRYGRPCNNCGNLTDGSYGREKAPELCRTCRNLARVPEHGTRSRYQSGCPCDPCREAATAAHRELRARGDAPNHGTHSGYMNYGCRCDACTAAHREHAWLHPEYKARWKAKVRGKCPEHMHGTTTGYTAYACRCDRCLTARREYQREYRRRRALASHRAPAVAPS